MIVEPKDFFRWLETASEEELRQRQKALKEIIDQLYEKGVKYQARYYLRLIEEEMVARNLRP